jgi:hypothetical protein
MRFEVADDGFICQVSAGAQADRVALGPRVVSLDDGELVCSFMTSRGLAVNDFVPVLSRSSDLGKTWSPPRPVWPALVDRWSLFVSISRGPSGDLYLYGSRTAIDEPGESNWCDATQGLKSNELVWARSDDSGRRWSEPSPIARPTAGSAEASGALCVTSGGRKVVCYSPYRAFDPSISVERNQVVALYCDDECRSWRHAPMLQFADRNSSAAEAWVVELSDGRLLGTAWHVAHDGRDLPNAFALSRDGAASWQPTQSTPIVGQSTALAAWTDGRALFAYNQRKQGEPGVWLAVVRPTDSDFGVVCNQLVWSAATATRSRSSGDLQQWSDFAFGEPCVARLRDNHWLVALWCIQPSGSGIHYVKLRCCM